MALLSVIVPTFNRAHFLPRAVDSALAQSFRDLEVIVIDDGSADGTADLLASRYGGDKRVRYFQQENAGVSAARNAGLRAAQGQYIALLDSDDWWQPWKCELQIRCLEALPEVGMVWTDMQAVGADGKVFEPKFLKQMYSAYRDFPEGTLFSSVRQAEAIWPDAPAGLAEVPVSDGNIFSQMIFGNLVHTSTVMLTRERYEKVRGFREDLRMSGEDYDFHLRTCREGPVAFLDISSICYQKGMADQLTRPGMGVWVSQNFLKTILPIIEQDRARISLRQDQLDNILADAYLWVGEQLLNANLPRSSTNLWQSLRLRRRSRTALLLAASIFPPAVISNLRSAYRCAKLAFPPKHAVSPQEAA